MSKEHSILFMPEMVQAYLAGSKTQTRRVIKLPGWSTETWDDFELNDDGWPVVVSYKTGCLAQIPCPYGVPGDTLWVKETFWRGYTGYSEPEAGEWRSQPTPTIERFEQRDKPGFDVMGRYMKKVPGIFMPRWASRISFPVLNIRTERVQNISLYDCAAELGETLSGDDLADAFLRFAFTDLWNKINAKRGYGWDNPTWPGWVWVIEFPKREVVK